MEERQLEIVIKAKDEASKAMETLGKKTSNLSDIFEKSFNNAVAISGAAVAALSAEAYIAVTAFHEAEKSDKQLEHAVLNVTHATRAQLEETQKLADELEKKGVLDGDNIKIGQAQLSTFGLSNKAVQGLSGGR